MSPVVAEREARLEELLSTMESDEVQVCSAPPAVDSEGYQSEEDGITMSMRSWLQWRLG